MGYFFDPAAAFFFRFTGLKDVESEFVDKNNDNI